MLTRQSTTADTRKRDAEACVLTPSIPTGRCMGALWVAHSPCSGYHLSCGSSSQVHIGSFHKLKKCFLMWVCFRCGAILSCSDWHKIVFLFPLHNACHFESYAAHRTPPLSAVSCKKQQQAEDSSTVEKAEAARRENRAPKRIQQAAQQQQCGYVCIQAKLIATNPGSMEEACEYGLPRGTCFVACRLELVAVAGRLWISWCVSVGRIFFVLFSFFFLRTNTAYCKYEATLPHVPLH